MVVLVALPQSATASVFTRFAGRGLAARKLDHRAQFQDHRSAFFMWTAIFDVNFTGLPCLFHIYVMLPVDTVAVGNI